MKAIIIGLGSMGKRRARLLKSILDEVEIIGIDFNEQRALEFNELGYKTCLSINEIAYENIDIAFVCTSPISHDQILKQLITYGIDTFTEINLVDNGYSEFVNEKDVKLFLSSTMLYRKEIEYIISKVSSINKPLSYTYHVGQYLPNWHPWENYKDFFVGNKETNGCRELFGIELPWVIEAFGEIDNLQSTYKKVTELEIDFPDRYFVTLTHKNGTQGVIIVDVVCPKTVRNLKIFAENLQITWGGTPETLFEFDVHSKEDKNINVYNTYEQDKNYSENIVETAYVDEIIDFLNFVQNKSLPKYSFEKDLYTIEIMNKIEE